MPAAGGNIGGGEEIETVMEERTHPAQQAHAEVHTRTGAARWSGAIDVSQEP